MSVRHERVKYFVVALPDGDLTYSYSAVQMQEDLNKLLVGQKIKSIYVNLNGYLNAFQRAVNTIDLSYMGGLALIIFDKTVLELAIHVEGMIEYRYFPVWEMELQERYDRPPDDMVLSDRYFFDISGHELTFEYRGKTVQSISVEGTDTWGFSQQNFDNEIAKEAAEKHDLPTEIVLHTNDFDISFIGDSIEYYYIAFER